MASMLAKYKTMDEQTRSLLRAILYAKAARLLPATQCVDDLVRVLHDPQVEEWLRGLPHASGHGFAVSVKQCDS